MFSLTSYFTRVPGLSAILEALVYREEKRIISVLDVQATAVAFLHLISTFSPLDFELSLAIYKIQGAPPGLAYYGSRRRDSNLPFHHQVLNSSVATANASNMTDMQQVTSRENTLFVLKFNRPKVLGITVIENIFTSDRRAENPKSMYLGFQRDVVKR